MDNDALCIFPTRVSGPAVDFDLSNAREVRVVIVDPGGQRCARARRDPDREAQLFRPAPAKMVNLFVKLRIVPEIENVTATGLTPAVRDERYLRIFPKRSRSGPTRGIGPKGDVEFFGEGGSEARGKNQPRRSWLGAMARNQFKRIGNAVARGTEREQAWFEIALKLVPILTARAAYGKLDNPQPFVSERGRRRRYPSYLNSG